MSKKQNDMSLYLFHQGTNFESYRYMGCHVEVKSGKFHYTFRTWAPNAKTVSVVGDFCDWENGQAMQRISENGVWELQINSKDSLHGMPYKFKIFTSNHQTLLKGDPYANFSRGLADGASLIWHTAPFNWEDKNWLTFRKKSVSTSEKGHYLSTPVNIYEAHLPSFSRHDDGTYFTYTELADLLAPYLKKMGYTHIEILPITEYPYDGSWGYQVGAYFAPTSRMGTPEDFKYFVNMMHKHGIGVIMDWVPAHFPKDAWGLFEFDGAPLYEYQGKDRQESSSWGTRYFDVGREEVQSFLVSSAMYWLEEFHIDGLRVDAVASMLYLDYDRMPGEWVPNVYGDRHNLEAIAFLKKLNQAVFTRFSDVLMIAEESTDFPKITAPVSEGGLGFNLKWNMGWANDMYNYMGKDPAFRKYHHKALNFPLMYAFKENYVLPVSHDEVVHGKKSLIDKMHGSYEQKFAQMRTFLLMMMTYPGKKMLFMGTEFAQFSEWAYQKGLEWFMLDFEHHRNLRTYVASLNRFYLTNPPLWEIDFAQQGFEWIYADESDRNLLAYRRIDSHGQSLIAVVSFSGAPNFDIEIPAKEGMVYSLAFESMQGILDGQSFKVNKSANNSSFRLSLPPFSGAVFYEKSAEGTKIKLK